MLEKMFETLPNWLKSKVVVRIVYTASSFLAARIIAFLTGDYLAKITGEIVEQAGHIGIQLQLKVVSVDQRVLEGFITGILMIGAEFVINHFHENTVKPAILASQDTPPPAGKV